jgi:hypothetical protein
VKVQHEPKRAANRGAPDFKVTESGLILGYVENKGIDENLNKVVLTDYLDFAWINKFGDPQRERLCHATDLESKKFKLDENRVAAVNSWGGGRPPPGALSRARRHGAAPQTSAPASPF